MTVRSRRWLKTLPNTKKSASCIVCIVCSYVVHLHRAEAKGSGVCTRMDWAGEEGALEEGAKGIHRTAVAVY